jgi:hypothetical protein
MIDIGMMQVPCNSSTLRSDPASGLCHAERIAGSVAYRSTEVFLQTKDQQREQMSHCSTGPKDLPTIEPKNPLSAMLDAMLDR